MCKTCHFRNHERARRMIRGCNPYAWRAGDLPIYLRRVPCLSQTHVLGSCRSRRGVPGHEPPGALLRRREFAVVMNRTTAREGDPGGG
eukprot:6110564-Pyramimonas_sp.AAC.1